MKRHCVFLAALVAALLTWNPDVTHAASVSAADPDPETLRAAGWRQIAPELFQLNTDGVTHTVAFGEAGLRFELGLVATEIEKLQAVLEAEPNAYAFDALQDLEERRRELIRELGPSHRAARVGDLLDASGGLVGSGGRSEEPEDEKDGTAIQGSGNLAASLIGSQGGRSDADASDDNGGYFGSGHAVTGSLDESGLMGSTGRTDDSEEDGGGTLGSGTLDDSGALGSGARVGEVSSLDLDPAPCNQVSLAADAGPGVNGPAASARADYSTTCGIWGEVYCYSYASGYRGTVFADSYEIDPPRSGNYDQSCRVSTSVEADQNCYAQGYARVRTYDRFGTLVTYVEQETSTACADLQVGVDGTRYLIVPYGGCATASWSAFSNLSGTAFTWKYDGTAVASGSTYGRTYCSTNPGNGGYSEFHTVQAVGSNGGQSASSDLILEVFYASGGGGGGCTDPSALRPCAGEL